VAEEATILLTISRDSPEPATIIFSEEEEQVESCEFIPTVEGEEEEEQDADEASTAEQTEDVSEAEAEAQVETWYI